jgi:hypothetical protein
MTPRHRLSKLGVLVSRRPAPEGLRYTRVGNFFDRAPGALKGIPFCLDVTSDEYRELWPQRYEPWSAELEVFHDPFGRHTVPFALLPETIGVSQCMWAREPQARL